MLVERYGFLLLRPSHKVQTTKYVGKSRSLIGISEKIAVLLSIVSRQMRSS